MSTSLQRQSHDDPEAILGRAHAELEERIKEQPLTMQQANQELLAENSMFQITLAVLLH